MSLRSLFGYLILIAITTTLIFVGLQLLPAQLSQIAPQLVRPVLLGIALVSALVLVLAYALVGQTLLHDSSRPDYDPLKVTKEFSERVIGIKDEVDLAEATSAVIQEMLGVKQSAWMLVTPQATSSAVRVVAGTKRLAEPAKPIVMMRNNLLLRTLDLKRKPLLRADLEADAKYANLTYDEREWMEQLGAELYVPVFDAGILTAVLMVGAKNKRQPFLQADLELLTILSSQAAAILKTMRVIADLKQLNESTAALNQTLRTANETQQKMAAARSDFLAIASHELRTPITQLLGFAEILGTMAREDCVDPKQISEMTDNIMKAGIRLGEVVTQIMEMAQIDVDAVTLSYVTTTVDGVLRQALEPYTRALQERRLTLKVKGLKTLPPLRADEPRLVQAFSQLASNAIKFTPDGGQIEISARLLPAEGEAPAQVEVVFADSGIGIAAEHQALIFEKFYQVGSAAQHSTSTTKFMGGGPGLGLPVAKGILEKHGGRIWVESPGCDPQKLPGSKFHVMLPVAPPVIAAEPAASTNQPKETTRSPKQSPFIGM